MKLAPFSIKTRPQNSEDSKEENFLRRSLILMPPIQRHLSSPPTPLSLFAFIQLLNTAWCVCVCVYVCARTCIQEKVNKLEVIIC